MKFWRLLAHGEFREAWAILARRPDSEHEQALIRIVLLTLILIYLYFYWFVVRNRPLTVEEVRILWTAVLYPIFSIGLFFLITIEPGISPPRRYIGIFGDLVLASHAIAMSEEAGAPLYIIMLWVIFGNGFRYGRRYLFVATAVGTVGFGAAIYFNAFWSHRPLLGGGLLIGIVMLSLYISALLKKLTMAGKRAEEANKAKSRFLANMSHEMRTPLNGIIGLIDLLKGTKLTEEQVELTRTIDSSARTLLFLMQDVLDLSKIEAGRVSIHTSDFDLHSLLKNTVAIIEPQAKSKGLGLFLQVPPNVPFLLKGDQLLLRQVLLNLLGNAVKFTHCGEVEVRVSVEKDELAQSTIRFEVIDTGIGIAPEAQKRIFDRFAQADDSITRRYGGTGLGTTISKEIVEMMGGEIGVQSIPGSGTTFWFTVRLGKQGIGPGEASASTVLTDRRALIVSADPSVTEAVRMHLSAWGVRTVSVARSAQAFAQVVSASNAGLAYDFIVVAKQGLDMDSLEFARVIKSDPTIHHNQLVLVTAHEEQAGHYTRRGYSATLTDPVDKTLLFNALHFAKPELKGDDSSIAPIADRYRLRAAGKKLRVLVAEDNPTNQMVILKLLERAGHDVTLVNDGEKALDALKSRQFDITLMDLHMPVMGGIEAAKLYRFMSGSSSRMPIVALTADATPEARKECEEAGMQGCITKPIETGKLLELFDELSAAGGLTPQGNDAEEATSSEAGGVSRSAEMFQCLDPKALQELIDLGGNTDFMARVAWAFLKGAKEKVRDMEQAVERNDIGSFRELAHALKGNSGQIGARTLMRVCDKFSGITTPELARNGPVYLEGVKEELSRVRAELDQFLGNRKSAVS